MIVKELREYFVNSLSGQYHSDEVLSFFYILTDHFFGLRRVDVAIQLDKLLPEHKIVEFTKTIARLQNFEPIQYILGETEFYGFTFKVDENVLIPRPETEELVDWILKDCNKERGNQQVRILDIGTGSGCIAISLAKNLPNASIEAIDVSDNALAIARKNAKYHNVEVDFLLENILTTERLNEYDIIVSNPPYVRDLEKKEIQQNVLDNEPHLALFVSDNDPLVFYTKITQLAKESLKSDGKLYFEINQYLGLETQQMIIDNGFASVLLKKDINTNDRMIRACII